VNVSAPFFRTSRKCLKTLAGGDPYGVTESHIFQRGPLSNQAGFDPFGYKTTERDCLTFPNPPSMSDGTGLAL
jgi:hypothetical protein